MKHVDMDVDVNVTSSILQKDSRWYFLCIKIRRLLYFNDDTTYKWGLYREDIQRGKKRKGEIWDEWRDGRSEISNVFSSKVLLGTSSRQSTHRDERYLSRLDRASSNDSGSFHRLLNKALLRRKFPFGRLYTSFQSGR